MYTHTTHALHTHHIHTHTTHIRVPCIMCTICTKYVCTQAHHIHTSNTYTPHIQHACTYHIHAYHTQTIGAYKAPCITNMYTCHMPQTHVHMLHHTYHTVCLPCTAQHTYLCISLICTHQPHTVLMHLCQMHSTHLYTCTVDMDTALLGASPRILRLADIGWCDMRHSAGSHGSAPLFPSQ